MIRAHSQTDAPSKPLILFMDPEERKRRDLAALALIEEWADDVESEQDQREMIEVLRQALDPDRIASNRPAFP